MERLGQLADDVSEIKVAVGKLEVTSAKQEENLREHMRRTDLAEAQVNELKTFVHEVRTHIRGVKWAGGVIVAAVGLAKTLGLF